MTELITNTIKDAPGQINELGQDDNNIDNNTETTGTTNPINGRDLYDEIKDTYNRYMTLQEGQAEALAWWAMFSHTIDAFNIAPKLLITSPEKRCGKSTLLDILHGMVRVPMMASNITPAAIFRAIDAWKPSIIIDEADTFIHSGSEINGIINSGHRKSSAYVMRTIGENHEPKQFSTWAPMVLAMIGKPKDTIVDRSINIELKRKMDSDIVERFIFSRVGKHLEQLKEQIAQWAQENFPTLELSDPDMPEGLNDRAMDNWIPLVSIADAIDKDCGRRAREVALILSSIDDETTPEVQLLSDIQNIFTAIGRDKIETPVLLENLYGTDDGLWAEWNRGKELTANQLAKKLKPFGIHPKKFRDGNRTPRGYVLEDFLDAFGRYLDCSVLNTLVPASVPPKSSINSLENKDCSSVPSKSEGWEAVKRKNPRIPEDFWDDLPEDENGIIDSPNSFKNMTISIFDESEGNPQEKISAKAKAAIFDD